MWSAALTGVRCTRNWTVPLRDDHSSFSYDFHQYPLLPPSVELAIKDLLPRTKIQLPFRYRHYYLSPHYLSLHVRIGIVFPGIVVAVLVHRFVRSQFLQPPVIIAVKPAFVVVDENGRSDVHRVYESNPFPDAAFKKALSYLGGNIDESAASRYVEPEFLSVTFHKPAYLDMPDDASDQGTLRCLTCGEHWRDAARIASLSIALLYGSHHRRADWSWKLNRSEVALRIQVILARLVKYTKPFVLRRVRIAKNPIDLPSLEGNLVALIFDANNRLLRRRWHSGVVDVAPDLELFTSNAVSFVPGYLGLSNGTIRQPDASKAFTFPPSAATVKLAQSPKLSDGGSSGKSLGIGDVSDNLEVHRGMLSERRCRVKVPHDVRQSSARARQ